MKGCELCQEILSSKSERKVSQATVGRAKDLHDLLNSFQERMERRGHLLEVSLEFHILVQQVRTRCTM